jgi:hypothetical protein
MSESDAGGCACARADMRGSTKRKRSRVRGSLAWLILVCSSQGTEPSGILKTEMIHFTYELLTSVLPTYPEVLI